MTSCTMEDSSANNVTLPLDVSSQSAPTFSLFSEEGNSLDIDINTGLPKLPVELPPEIFMETSGAGESEIRRKSVTFDPNLNLQRLSEESTSSMIKSPVTSKRPVSSNQYSPETRKSSGGLHSTLELSQSVDGSASPTPSHMKRGRAGRHTMPLKNRSRSVFIRLQIPNQRTPPLPHRNLAIVGESDSDTDIQTAPVVDSTSRPFFLYDGTQRRASDSTALSGAKLNLSEVNVLGEESGSGTPQSQPEQSQGQTMWNNAGRRSSYLYLSDTDEDDQASQLSRTSSMTSHIGDETYITPFAQILANLHRIRSQFLSLFGLPADTRTSQTRTSTTSAPSPTSSPPKKLPEAVQRKLAMQTLEEFDWCLKKLESVTSAKSMGTMAQDKFRRILSRELSHMSGKSRSGNHVAEWVQNITDIDMGQNVVDRALGTMQDDSESDKFYLENPRLSGSGSMSHDVWARLKPQIKDRVPKEPPSASNTDYCVRVPMFGVSDPKLDKKAMREFMVSKLDAWDVDTFHLDTVSAGNPLVSAAYLVFKKRDFFSTFKISPHIFINFVSKIQSAYFPNPYHNKVHAADVLLATNNLLKAEALTEVFTDLEVLAALVAAAIHDVGHPARTNQFLVNVHHDLAVLYNDNSVLENHHLAVAFKTLQDPMCDFLENFDRDQRHAFRRMVIDMVLATDMAKHFKHLGELKTLLETNKVANDGLLVLDKYSDRSEVLQCMIHCADLSNPTKQEDLAALWSHRIMEENFLQGDEEKSLGIPLNPLGDREQVSLCKCQVTFIDFIVYPLWETWAELVYPAGQPMLDNIARTREYWNAMVDPNSPPPSDDQDEDSSEQVMEDLDQESSIQNASSEKASSPNASKDVSTNQNGSPQKTIGSPERSSNQNASTERALNPPTESSNQIGSPSTEKYPVNVSKTVKGYEQLSNGNQDQRIKVHERSACNATSSNVGCCGLVAKGKDGRESPPISEDTFNSFAASPISDRRTSFKTMKNYKALEESS